MKMRFVFGIALLVFLTGCKDRFSNKRTSRIYNLNLECLNDSAWIFLKDNYSVKNIHNDEFLSALDNFKQLQVSFPVEIYYFKEGPEELIAVSFPHDCVRYVYNPQISKNILNGLSPALSKKNKERVGARIQDILKQYQCDEEKNHRYVQEWDKDVK